MPAKNNKTMQKVRPQFMAKSPLGPSDIHAFEEEQASEDAKKQAMIDRTAPVRESMKAEADKRYARQKAKAVKKAEERAAVKEEKMRAEEEEQRKKDKRARRLTVEAHRSACGSALTAQSPATKKRRQWKGRQGLQQRGLAAWERRRRRSGSVSLRPKLLR